MKIRSYRIDELDAFCATNFTLKDNTIPVSPLRVESYKNNPRAHPSDPVLFTLESDRRLVAYRTLLPDILYNDTQAIPFAWLSGNYVQPDYRRKGFSTQLFKVAEEAWQGRLMFTNYAPASKAVYDNTGVFRSFLERPSARYYMRSSLRTLMKSRYGDRRSLGMIDGVINTIHDGKVIGMTFPLPPEVIVNEIDAHSFFAKKLPVHPKSESLFRRDTQEFRWITGYPWVTDKIEAGGQPDYSFSWIADRFKNLIFKMEGSDPESRGWLWITVHNEKMQIPYFFYNDKRLVVTARQVVLTEMVKHRCSYLSAGHPDLGPALGTRSNPFLLTRRISQNYFIHKNLFGSLPAQFIVEDGDGDCVFS